MGFFHDMGQRLDRDALRACSEEGEGFLKEKPLSDAAGHQPEDEKENREAQLFHPGCPPAMKFSASGPNRTIKIVGKIKTISGNRSLSGAWAAFFSAS